MKFVHFSLGIAVAALCACGNPSDTQSANAEEQATHTTDVNYTQVAAPAFNEDSAFAFVARQVKFGTRVPNSATHDACGKWLAAKLAQYGAKVTEQPVEVTAFDGTKLRITNIIGSFAPEKSNRVLLCAHWDTRPFADQDKDPAFQKKPILGANDGASGVGILLEIARNLAQKSPAVGVDIIFWDAEDYGKGEAETYCLGTQYWAWNKHIPNYTAMYGVNLDMVGAKGAIFPMEGNSLRYANAYTRRIWKAAAQLGYNQFFMQREVDAITDDHVFVSEKGGIPCVDIIDLPANQFGTFFPAWHTHKDDMSNISRETLKAVGQTVQTVVYAENYK